MQAIRTRYFGPSNVKGSRIQAKCDAKTIYVPYDHALDIQGNHDAARQALVEALGWNGPHYMPMVSGCFDNDYYHVFMPKGE